MKCTSFRQKHFTGTHSRQYRTKSVWRLCTPSACKFPFRACFVSSRTHLACIFSEIFRENTRKSTKDFLRFSLHLSKNLTTQSAYVRYETDSHISQKCSWIHQVFTPLFVSSDEKFDDASVAQSLCGIAVKRNLWYRACLAFCQGRLFCIIFRKPATIKEGKWCCCVAFSEKSLDKSNQIVYNVN